MHRSRLCVLMIDCSEDTMESGLSFWSEALGMAPATSEDPSSPYVLLKDSPYGVQIVVQRVNDPSRYHLDIETDNVEAEVKRLEALGATRKEMVESWWIMEAPSGHLFCVVPPQTDDFPARTNVWED